MFTLAINSARGPGVSTRWAAHLICAIPALLILLPLAKTASAQATAEGRQASIASPGSMSSPDAEPAKIVQMNDEDPEYQPSSIVITAGQTVEWHNNGQVSHSVVDDAKRAANPGDALIPAGVPTFNSGNVMPGASFKHTFTVPGRYRYFCMSHELDGMVGQVIVLPAGPGGSLIAEAKPQPPRTPEPDSATQAQIAAISVQTLLKPPNAITQPASGSVKVIQMNDDMPMYQPDSIVITAGQTVEWHNNGQVSHSVVDDAKRAARPDDSLIPSGVDSFSSGGIMPGGTYRHTFTVPGRYRYFCASHELDNMVGEITVRPASPDAEPLISQAKSQPWKNLERSSDPPVSDP
ncbi:MAG TPA: plastocyanin/azurin family copper-binding protein [Candidatus Binataceae bacterium]|nr:plastocyanin/azurin family copper-binding protein [Candidatus Binataceae bacterium]